MSGIKFTPKGINILEVIVLKEFLRNPSEMRKATRVLKFKLTPLIHKYLRKYLEIEEDLSRIRLGMEPIYNPLEHYVPKSRQK